MEGSDMNKKVKLSEIIDGMEFQSDENHSYLNKKMCKVVTVSEEEFHAAEMDDSLNNYPEWQHEMIEIAREILTDEGREKFIDLPSKFDIHEYSIMERFCISIEDNKISDSLYHAIKGSGAFRRFKDGIYRFGIEEDWYRYRDEAIKRIAIDWCDENGIEYIDD